LAARRGVHHRYDRDHFDSCFSRGFFTELVEPVEEGGRVLYLMRRR
jgi:hypothetical protein